MLDQMSIVISSQTLSKVWGIIRVLKVIAVITRMLFRASGLLFLIYLSTCLRSEALQKQNRRQKNALTLISAGDPLEISNARHELEAGQARAKKIFWCRPLF